MSQRDIHRIEPIVPERDDAVRRRPAGATPPAKKTVRSTPSGGNGGGGSKLPVIIAFLAIIGVAVVGWMQFGELSTRHTNLQQRFDALEARLSSTDESVSQSGAALQMRINQHKEDLELHMSEIRKLWDLANKRNRPDIDKNRKDIDFLAAKRTAMEKTLGELKTTSDKDSKILANVSANYLAMQAEVDAMSARLREAQEGVSKLQSAISRIDSQLKTNSEAVASFDAYRRQVNQKIYNLEQRSPGASTSP